MRFITSGSLVKSVFGPILASDPILVVRKYIAWVQVMGTIFLVDFSKIQVYPSLGDMKEKPYFGEAGGKWPLEMTETIPVTNALGGKIQNNNCEN
jgi:hypothetical protein